MTQPITDPREAAFIEPITVEEVDGLVWSKLLEWLNGEPNLPQEVRELFIDRSTELRLRMQAIFIEIQRRFLATVAAETEFEDTLRRDIRANIPYMSAHEKVEALRTLSSTTESRMARLEAQLAGFDFFNTIQVSVQSLTDSKIAKDLTASVKQIPSAKRQHLLAMLNEIVKKIEEPPPLIQDVVEVVDITEIPNDTEPSTGD